ncbi:MAG: diaminopimelate decarboxylase [Planctomycetota bacterium]|jgi:diaminopimelate decarboxylase
MDHFHYHDGVLHGESVDLRSLTAEFGTPLYVYSKRTLLDHYDRMRTAFSPLGATICFSVKSCPNLSILRLLRERGASFDVVSGGELARAIEIEVDPSSIVFAGVGKTDTEIRAALDTRIGWFNVESEEELGNLAEMAAGSGKTARVAVRVNPDVDPQTHRYTTTGKREMKFGVDIERGCKLFEAFDGREGIDLAGIHLHIGSPVHTIEPYVEAITKTLTLIDKLRRCGHNVRAINIGGGFGAHYQGSEAPPAAAYAERIVPLLAKRDLEVLLEPGRSIAANAGVLLTRTLYTKASGDRQFVIVDAGITELIRPALYGAYHFVWPVHPYDGAVPESRGVAGNEDSRGAEDEARAGSVLVDVVGPICESGDFIAKDRWLPPVSRGNLLCVFSAGAYGSSMSSQYNSRPRAAEVLVDGATVRLIRRRETYDDLVSAERL